MQKAKLYRHDVGRSKQDLEQCLEHLKSLGFHISPFDNTTNEYNARKRIGKDRECHVVIRRIESGKYRAYLHIDIVVSDLPVQHRMLHDPEMTARWGKKIFGDVIR